MRVRREVVAELQNRRDLYEAYIGSHMYDKAIRRNSWFKPTWAARRNWMNLMEDLVPVATIYQAAVHVIQSALGGCYTILPLESRTEGAPGPVRQIIILYDAKGSHCIRLSFEDWAPLPGLLHFWHNLHKESVNGWHNPWGIFFEKWEEERNGRTRDMPQHNASQMQTQTDCILFGQGNQEDPFSFTDSPSFQEVRINLHMLIYHLFSRVLKEHPM